MKRWEKVAWCFLALAALTSRFFALGDRAPHHDEAVHAHIARELLLLGKYRYDPTYHGPLQFYILAPLMGVFGQNDTVARSYAAACGVALVLLPLLLRRRLGPGPALAMGTLILTSPTLTYFSRFARNDVPVALFTLAFLALVLVGQRTHRYHLPWLGVLAAAHLASKETFYVYAVLLGFAFVATLATGKSGLLSALLAWVRQHKLELVASLLLFIASTVTLYTVFFRYPEDSYQFFLRAVSYWWGQHKIERVAGPWWYYLPRLSLYELAIWPLAAWYFWHKRRQANTLVRFSFFWALASLVLYAYLGEKVPWLLVHQVLPLALPAASALARLWGPLGSPKARLVSAALLGMASWNLVQACYRNPAIEPATGKAELLVYVQTVPSFKEIIREGRERAAAAPGQTVLAVAGEAGWPLSWSWANLPVWWDKPVAGQDIQMFLCDPGQEQEIVNTLGKAFGCGEVPLRAWWVEETPFTLRRVGRWFLTREAWSPVGFQSVVVCRVLDRNPAGPTAP